MKVLSSGDASKSSLQPVFGGVQGQVGCGFQQPSLVEGLPTHSRRVGIE